MGSGKLLHKRNYNITYILCAHRLYKIRGNIDLHLYFFRWSRARGRFLSFCRMSLIIAAGSPPYFDSKAESQ